MKHQEHFMKEYNPLAYVTRIMKSLMPDARALADKVNGIRDFCSSLANQLDNAFDIDRSTYEELSRRWELAERDRLIADAAHAELYGCHRQRDANLAAAAGFQHCIDTNQRR